MARVALEGVGKVYEDGTRAVDGLTLDIESGEFLVLVGPSGCGKTTALRMVAGLENISEGTITIDDKIINGIPPRDRDVAMVFQSYALYPHLSVGENIAFGLRLRKVPKKEIQQRVKEAAHILGLEEYLNRKPRHLSGGQRQRVAMGRAIVRRPQAFLMDEPLSNLDAKLRVQMRAEIARLQQDLGVTTLYVTHDQVEAMTLGDRVAVMKKGVLQQVAPPQELYDRPVNLFVAGFIGSPAMNMFGGRIIQSPNGQVRVSLGEQELVLGSNFLDSHPRLQEFFDHKVVIGIRPEDMEDASLLDDKDIAPGSTLRSVAELVEAMGSDVLVHFAVKAEPVLTEDMVELARDTDKSSDVEEKATSGNTVATGRFAPRTQIAAGENLTVHVNTDKLHFFDSETGLSLRGEDVVALTKE